jgi:cellulose biosynthesis protein BcsS
MIDPMWRAGVRRVGRFDTGVGAALRASGAGGLSFLAVCLFAAMASAQSDPPRTEIFTGFEASDNYASGYVGGGYAFGKPGLYERGFRLRAVGAFGRYHYDGTLLTDGVYVPTTFDGEDAFLSALIGYQFRPGRLIVKLFAGLEAEDQHIVPHDPNNSVQGSEVGLRLQAETWLDMSPRLFLSADASYGTAFQEYCSLVRLGFRLRPRLSFGLEGGALGNEEYDAGRGGGFAWVNFRATEVTLSGGFTGNYLEDEPSGYVALGVYRAF